MSDKYDLKARENIRRLSDSSEFQQNNDEADTPTRANVPKLSEHPALQQKATEVSFQNEKHGEPQTNHSRSTERDPSDDQRLNANDKQRIVEIDEDIKAPIAENDSLGYPLSPKIKKSEQFFHDACERIRELIKFALVGQKDQFERDGVLGWMLRIQAYMHAEQPKSKRLEHHDVTLAIIVKKTFGDTFYSSWRKTIDDKRKESLSNIKTLNLDAQKVLDDFYANWAVVDDHGKTIIFHDDPNGQLSRRSIDAFTSYFRDVRITSIGDDGLKRTQKDATKIWLDDPGNGKRKYNKVLMDPSQTFDPKSDVLNLWRNFVVAPQEGDCHLMQEFVLNVICCGNSAHYNWLMAYYAHMVQKPWDKPGTAVVLRGIKRIGKSFFGRRIGELIDGPFDPLRDIKHYFPTENRNDLLGDFTGHLEYVLLLQLEELVWARSHKDESKMKEVTTGETMSIRPMHSPSRIVKNYLRPLLISNADWAVPMSWDESRYFVLEVSTAHKDDHSYFAGINNQWNNGGAEAFMYYLKNYDITGYNLREAPRTKAATKQLIESLRGVERWFYERLNDYDLPFVDFDRETGQPKLLRGGAYQDFLDWSNVIREGDRSDKTKFGTMLRQIIPWIKEGWHTPANGLSSEKRLHAQIWPSLQECRDFWINKFLDGKMPDDWDDLTLNWIKKEDAKDITMGINEFQTNKDWVDYMKDYAKDEEKSVKELTIRYLN